jgi:hypothetical protein
VLKATVSSVTDFCFDDFLEVNTGTEQRLEIHSPWNRNAHPGMRHAWPTLAYITNTIICGPGSTCVC